MLAIPGRGRITTRRSVAFSPHSIELRELGEVRPAVRARASCQDLSTLGIAAKLE